MHGANGSDCMNVAITTNRDPNWLVQDCQLTVLKKEICGQVLSTRIAGSHIPSYRYFFSHTLKKLGKHLFLVAFVFYLLSSLKKKQHGLPSLLPPLRFSSSGCSS